MTRRRIAAIALAVCSPALLTACGTSFSAQTNQQYQSAAGADLRTGPVQIFNAVFVDNEDGTASLTATILARGDDAAVADILVNDQSVRLGKKIKLPAEESVAIGYEGEVVVADETVVAGRYATLTVVTEDGASYTVNAPTTHRSDEYKDIPAKPKKAVADDAVTETESATDNGAATDEAAENNNAGDVEDDTTGTEVSGQ